MKKGEMTVMEQLFLSTLGLDPAVGTLRALSVGLADLCPAMVHTAVSLHWTQVRSQPEQSSLECRGPLLATVSFADCGLTGFPILRRLRSCYLQEPHS